MVILIIIIGLLILSGTIMFHELGHFVFAKLCKVKVNEFALGMGPKILSFQRGETTYALRLFPIGGMCAMQGEDEEDDTEGSFQKAKVWQRILIVAAGPIFNFILAFIIALIVIFCTGVDPARITDVYTDSPAYAAGLREGDIVTKYEGQGVSNARELYMYSVFDGLPEDSIDLEVQRGTQKIDISFSPQITKQYMLGINYSTESDSVTITGFGEDSPLEKAGLKAGDTIISINGSDVSTVEKFNTYLANNPLDGSELEIGYQRDGKTFTITASPVITESMGGGFAFNMAREKADFGTSISYSFGEIKYWINTTIKSIGGLFTGRFAVSDLSGPVGVVSVIGDVYESARPEGGFTVLMSLLNIVILLSANLGVMNLLPLPALDGGRLIFLFVEMIRRKPCNQRLEGTIHFIGIVALLGLAVFVAFNDVIKLF